MHTGALQAAPTPASSTFPSLQDIGNTSFQRTYSQRISGSPSVVGATDGVPFILPFGSVTKCRMFWLRVNGGGSLKVKFTTPLATDQVLNVADEWLWHSPNEGDQMTAIKLIGTGETEYLVAGD